MLLLACRLCSTRPATAKPGTLAPPARRLYRRRMVPGIDITWLFGEAGAARGVAAA
ncbi:MAG: hypothetical protein M0Z28_25155 [Rhodospirillales bacterium]|nr:hypothetical protein [Rhodospirillales bacterium]